VAFRLAMDDNWVVKSSFPIQLDNCASLNVRSVRMTMVDELVRRDIQSRYSVEIFLLESKINTDFFLIIIQLLSSL
jgi:hypothetical protein